MFRNGKGQALSLQTTADFYVILTFTRQFAFFVDVVAESKKNLIFRASCRFALDWKPCFRLLLWVPFTRADIPQKFIFHFWGPPIHPKNSFLVFGDPLYTPKTRSSFSGTPWFVRLTYHPKNLQFSGNPKSLFINPVIRLPFFKLSPLPKNRRVRAAFFFFCFSLFAFFFYFSFLSFFFCFFSFFVFFFFFSVFFFSLPLLLFVRNDYIIAVKICHLIFVATFSRLCPVFVATFSPLFPDFVAFLSQKISKRNVNNYHVQTWYRRAGVLLPPFT